MFRCLKMQKIQGTYFKISALYFKIYGLYFLRQAMCFFGGVQCDSKIALLNENFSFHRQFQTVIVFTQSWLLLIFTPFSRGDAFALFECLCEIAH